MLYKLLNKGSLYYSLRGLIPSIISHVALRSILSWTEIIDKLVDWLPSLVVVVGSGTPFRSCKDSSNHSATCYFNIFLVFIAFVRVCLRFQTFFLLNLVIHFWKQMRIFFETVPLVVTHSLGLSLGFRWICFTVWFKKGLTSLISVYSLTFI